MRHLFDSPLGVTVPLGVPKYVIGVGAAALAAGIAATASAGTAIYNNYQANLANDEAYERTKELQQMQYEQQKELYEHQFNREAAYNDPSHLRELYEKAGYNPALLAHNGDIGQAATHPAMPGVPSLTSFGPRQVFPMDMTNGISGISQALAIGSEIKKNDAESFEKIVRSLPELGKSIGWNNVRSVAMDLLGMAGVSGSQYERQMEAYINSIELQNESVSLQNEIVAMYGKDKASLINQNLIFEGQRLYAEIDKLYSDKRLNEQSIKELISRATRNVAEASHLNADTKTLDGLRQYVVRSASLKADMDAYDKKEMETDFVQRTFAREWQRSDAGKAAATAAQTVSDNPETNLVNKILHAKDPSRRGRR